MSAPIVSKNIDSYDPDETKFYLGYREKDFARPHAKYFNPNVELISDEVQKGLICSPWANALSYEAADAHKHILQPGYETMENGFVRTKNGTMMVAVRTDFKQVSGEAWDWWFGWHSVETSRYKLWHPNSHQFSWRFPDTLDISNKSYADRYIGTFSFINEYLGNDCTDLTVAFIDPKELGIDKSEWPELGIEAMICAKLGTPQQGHITEGFDGVSYLIHQVRRLADGNTELRSRFWVKGMPEMGAHGLMVHCNMEMSHLAKFLPELYKEFRDTV